MEFNARHTKLPCGADLVVVSHAFAKHHNPLNVTQNPLNVIQNPLNITQNSLFLLVRNEQQRVTRIVRGGQKRSRRQL
jgi:hypothetical protein